MKTNHLFPIGNAVDVLEVKNISNKIRELRKKQGLTQKEMAGLCNVGTRFISDLENGKQTVHLGKVLQVLHRLGIRLSMVVRS